MTQETSRKKFLAKFAGLMVALSAAPRLLSQTASRGVARAPKALAKAPAPQPDNRAVSRGEGSVSTHV